MQVCYETEDSDDDTCDMHCKEECVMINNHYCCQPENDTKLIWLIALIVIISFIAIFVSYQCYKLIVKRNNQQKPVLILQNMQFQPEVQFNQQNSDQIIV
ncbi:Hypothetical_protein [Hexamita inflata]|uniref:Hypothetical_protein n=1 Tax=Hexamita inflata TaxID=28002 RepID=A0AA86RGK4_9EUKA|nr:Hypothetical protein HINF_LOCUS13241 [Hexamita inflata]CAI9966740.1 Hypothetical protein HINF_LOCUS54385 [Hexamita inflata]